MTLAVSRWPLAVGLALLVGPALSAQSLPTGDPMLKRIWEEGMERSQADALAQTLMDSIGPRLVGAPGMKAASDWVIARFGSWGVPARAERYGSWLGWKRGLAHLDLVAPRERSLEGGPLAWSVGTRGRPVEGPVVTLPALADSAAFAAWLPSVKGKYVAISFPPPTCRPDADWEEYAGGDPRMAAIGRMFGGGPARTAFHRMRAERAAADSAWRARVSATGMNENALRAAIAAAGAAGVLTTNWSGGYGVTRVFDARTDKAPVYWLSCEDYGLVARLAERNQGPRLRATSTAEFTGEAAAMNTIAEVKGTEKPDEYVVLSAHFDSWDGASGATDNGTGTVVMMEAMRILKAVYPNPKRTIVVGLWDSEEQGLNGSAAFATDHPEVVSGMQALFNQDNGTGRIASASALGLLGTSEALGRWFTALPDELKRDTRLDLPGNPSGGGTDHASFICAGAPAVGLNSEPWDYFSYTWHTNRDTYDKVVMENVRHNATLVAALAYLAAEDPVSTGRDRRVLGINPRTGQQATWPACSPPDRSYSR
jgi:carboxypeptidase Q